MNPLAIELLDHLRGDPMPADQLLRERNLVRVGNGEEQITPGELGLALVELAEEGRVEGGDGVWRWLPERREPVAAGRSLFD